MSVIAQENATEWTATQRKYMGWLALSSFDREPLTKESFAQENNLNPVTLYRWQKLPGFMQEVQALITASLGDVYHDVMHSFKQEATKGSFPHQRMYMEMLRVYTPKQEIGGHLDITANVLIHMPDNGRDKEE